MPMLYFTTDPEANALLADDAFALVVGLAIYQQVPTEKAFAGPFALKERLGGHLDAVTVASMDPDALEAAFKETPAIHRFPANMAKRVQAVSQHIVDEYDGDASAIWDGASDADDLLERLKAVPGFGDYKARLSLGVLANRFGIKPAGYENHLPDWPSVADIAKPEDLAELKARKKAWKAGQNG